MPSFGDKVQIFSAATHLVGDCCVCLVARCFVSAGAAGVEVMEVKAMGPAVVHVGVESGGSRFSGTARGVTLGFSGCCSGWCSAGQWLGGCVGGQECCSNLFCKGGNVSLVGER